MFAVMGCIVITRLLTPEHADSPLQDIVIVTSRDFWTR